MEVNANDALHTHMYNPRGGKWEVSRDIETDLRIDKDPLVAMNSGSAG